MCKKAGLFEKKNKDKSKNVKLFSTIPKPTLDIIRFKYKVEILTSTGIFWCFQQNQFQIIELSDQKKKKKCDI